VVHCDTPTGALNSEAVRKVGEACSKTDALFYVDIVSSAGAVPVDIPGWGIDIGNTNNRRHLDLVARYRPDYKRLTFLSPPDDCLC
jgi:kynureninase